MDQIERLHRIDLRQLDQEQYFQALLQEVYSKKLLAPERLESIQLELIELLGKEVERYTNGESSSVRVEKAQQILLSITFCIGLYLKTFSDLDEILDILRREKISDLFYKGMEAAADRREASAKLLEGLKKNLLKVNNYSYHDSIPDGIAKFFNAYNVEFEAYEIPCDIDYQLFVPITKQIGVEYIHEYLYRLTLEHNFTKHFSDQKIDKLLYGFHKDSEHMLINIFELVLTNVLGLSLLEKNIKSLNITTEELRWLNERLNRLSREELIKKLESAMIKIREELNLDQFTTSYARQLLPQLADRIVNNLATDTLKEVFISFESNVQEEEVYIDGTSMEDESLRALIEELNSIETVTAKMYRIRETVRSLADMSLILEECFYGNDYMEVFRLLSSKKIEILRGRILEEAGPEADDYIPELEWQRRLLRIHD